jgi:L-fuconolactonase
MSTELETWLGSVTEEALEPDMPICDPHHHLWDRPNSCYLLDDLLEDTGSGHNITHTVFLECASEYRKTGPEELKSLGETEFVQGVAAENVRQGGRTNVAAGIIGFVDLRLGAAATPVLEKHIEAGMGRFRGIRHSMAWDPDPAFRSSRRPPQGLSREPSFRQGIKCLKDLGLSFDAWLYYPQHAELAELARAFPDLPIVLNHVGGTLGVGSYAQKRDEAFEEWKRGIAEIAACPNVVIKLGGLGMPICGFGLHERPKPPTSEELARVWAPHLLYCIEKFGPERCMFESNFPVDKVSCSYLVLWNAFKRLSQDFSASERAAMFRGAAMRSYRLEADAR